MTYLFSHVKNAFSGQNAKLPDRAGFRFSKIACAPDIKCTGEICPTYPNEAQDETVSSVLRKTVITFSLLSGIGQMTCRWKALEISYHLQFESHQKQ